MTWFLFLLVNVTLFLRPAEIVPSLAALPIYEVLIVGSCLGAFERIQRQLGPQSLVRQPITLCVLGILAAAALSHLTHGDVEAAADACLMLFKTVLYYLIFVALVNTPARFRQLLATLAVSGSALVTLCVVDYLELFDLTCIKHVSDWEGDAAAPGAKKGLIRMCGPGIFSDPNDLSIAIVLAGVLCSYFLASRRLGAAVRPLWLVPIGVLGIGLLCTHSRGGLLAAGSAVFVLVGLRYGRAAAVAMMIAGACVLPLVAGRQGNIDLKGGTGQERIRLWGEGLQALQSPYGLFGLGVDTFKELSGLVAHNSYVHAYVELGFFGGTLFFGCFFFAGLGLYRLCRNPRPMDDAEFARFTPYLAAVLASTAIGLSSLSRCYVATTYLIFGMAAAYLSLAGHHVSPPRLLVVWDQRHVRQLVGASSALLAGLFVFVKVFARYG